MANRLILPSFGVTSKKVDLQSGPGMRRVKAGKSASKPVAQAGASAGSVFINAPFDRRYSRIFDVVLFTIIDCGFRGRCALEIDDGSQFRLEKLCKIIGECQFAVHDLSRTQLDSINRLPRFNMPLELGIFLGARRFGGKPHSNKSCIILDTESFRFQKFISDIAGQDPRAHSNDPQKAASAVRNWLLTQAKDSGRIPGANIIHHRYLEYRNELPALCKKRHWDRSALTFKEKGELMFRWIEATPL